MRVRMHYSPGGWKNCFLHRPEKQRALAGGQSCAATLSARGSGHVAHGESLGTRKIPPPLRLRWAPDWSQRDQCHQTRDWWTESRCDSVCPRQRARGAWSIAGLTNDSAAPALRWASDWPQRGQCHPRQRQAADFFGILEKIRLHLGSI